MVIHARGCREARKADASRWAPPCRPPRWRRQGPKADAAAPGSPRLPRRSPARLAYSSPDASLLLTAAEGHRRARGLLWGRLRGVSSRMADSAPMEVRRGGGRPPERRQRCPGRAARGGRFRPTGQPISSSPGAAHAQASSAAASGTPLPPSRPYCAALQALPQVEQAQPVEEKKGKAKTSGKRFEIKKWNAVAM